MPSASTVPVAGRLAVKDAQTLDRRAREQGITISLGAQAAC
jgi:hypothetical protein